MHGELRAEGGGYASTWFDDESQLRSVADAVGDAQASPALLQNATLPERMRTAAETLVEASKRYSEEHGKLPEKFEATSWDAANLRTVADRWENLDREAEQVGALTYALLNAGWVGVTTAAARQLINDGWTKGEA